MFNLKFVQFIESINILTRSLIIKSDLAATKLNDWIKLKGYSVSEDPLTWKYYLNLSGEYHESDKTIMIDSFDTKESIEFTKEGLRHHPVTRETFLPHKPEYHKLVELYPEQEILIRGVIQPIDINEAIVAQDYSILSYSKSLIEPQETNLIDDLQTYINNYKIRWDIPTYTLVDDLYYSANLAIMFMNIPNWIFSIRLDNVMTNKVHSFHIGEHLKSNGGLDRYIKYLNTKQVLWLYRNIRYLNRNLGKKETFNLLVSKILTERNLGLAEYNLLTDTEDLSRESLLGVGTFNRLPLNQFHLTTNNEDFTPIELFDKIKDIALGNSSVQDKTIYENNYSFNNPIKNKLKTKVLESSTLDFSDSGVIIFTQELLKYWLYWSISGKYSSTFKFINPKTNSELVLDTKDSFILFLYVINLSMGKVITSIPKLRLNMVKIEEGINLEDFEGMISSEFLSNSIEEVVLTNNIPNSNIPYNYTFVNRVKDLTNEFYDYRSIYSKQEHFSGRGELQSVMDRLYKTIDVTLLEGTMEDWLISKDIDILGLESVEYKSFYESLVTTVTGIEYLEELSVRDIQKALVELLGELSSYNVNYIREVNEEPILSWDRIDTRLGDTSGFIKHSVRFKRLSVIVNNLFDKQYSFLELGNLMKIELLKESNFKSTVSMVNSLDYSFVGKPKSTIRYPIQKNNFSVIE